MMMMMMNMYAPYDDDYQQHVIQDVIQDMHELLNHMARSL